MKSTKKQAQAVYKSFRGTLHCFNGGTEEENRRMAPHCLELMREDAAKAAELVKNPNKHLRNDRWLWESIREAIPNQVKSFAQRYGL